MKKINRKILRFSIMNDFINIPLNLQKEEGIFQIYILTFLCGVFLFKFLHSFVYLGIRHNLNLTTVSFIFKLNIIFKTMYRSIYSEFKYLHKENLRF